VVAYISSRRDVRIDKASKVRFYLISPCLVEADIKDFSLLEITIDSLALDKFLHFFDLTSFERCYMLRDLFAMSFEDACRPRVRIRFEVATFGRESVLLRPPVNTYMPNRYVPQLTITSRSA